MTYDIIKKNISKKYSQKEIENILSAYMEQSQDSNPTAQAIRNKFKNKKINANKKEKNKLI